MAVVGALNQLVAGLHSGVDAGFKYGEKGRQNYANRKMGEAEAALSEYMAYDPAAKAGAVDTGDGSKPPKQPTSVDLGALRREFQAAARLHGDQNMLKQADERWASVLKQGTDDSIDVALRAIDEGDWGTVERAIEKGNGFIANGMLAKVKVHDDGRITVKGYDERTGEEVKEQELTKEHLLAIKAFGNDPAKAFEWQMTERDKAHQRQQAYGQTIRQAEDDKYSRAKTMSETEKNRAQAKYYSSGSAGSNRDAQSHSNQLRLQSDLNKAVEGYIEGAAMSANANEQDVAFENKHNILRVANAMAMEQQAATGQVPDLNEMSQVATSMVIRYVNGDEEMRRVLGPLLGQGSGIPVE